MKPLSHLTYIIGIPKGDEREKEQKKKIFEAVMTKSFPNLIKTLNLQFQEALMNPKKNKQKENYIRAHYNQIAENQL